MISKVGMRKGIIGHKGLCMLKMWKTLYKRYGDHGKITTIQWSKDWWCYIITNNNRNIPVLGKLGL